MKALVILIPIFFVLSSCKKDIATNQETECVLKIYPHETYYKSLDFNVGSYWVYQLQGSPTVFDTIKVYQKAPPSSNYLYSSGPSKGDGCDTFTQYKYSEIYFKHSYYNNTSNNFFYSLNVNNLCLNKRHYYSDPAAVAFLPEGTNITDTLRYSSQFITTKVFKQAFYTSLNIQNTSYSNVTLMYYYPSYSGFVRIWWSSGVGFIKFEFVNASSQIEVWELINHVVVY